MDGIDQYELIICVAGFAAIMFGLVGSNAGWFKSNWSKWNNMRVKAVDPSHDAWTEEVPYGIDSSGVIHHEAYRTDQRRVYLIQKKTNSRTGGVKFREVEVSGTYHKDRLPTLEELANE